MSLATRHTPDNMKGFTMGNLPRIGTCASHKWTKLVRTWLDASANVDKVSADPNHDDDSMTLATGALCDAQDALMGAFERTGLEAIIIGDRLVYRCEEAFDFPIQSIPVTRMRICRS